MKKTKKTISILLAFVLAVSLLILPVSAVEKTPAQKLEILGILVGAGSGVTPDYLATQATRITSAILYLKLKGLIDNAEEWTGSVNFDDANQALSIYARTIMGYLKTNPSLGFIGYQNKFSPNAVISAQEYYKVLLTALGYMQDVDFSWSNVISYANSKGLNEIASKTSLTINDFAKATVEALDAEVKGTGMTLLEKLVTDGVIDPDDAAAAGWDITPDLAIANVSQTASNKVAVTFTRSVNTSAAVVRLKQGVVYYYATVAWNSAKTTATLTTSMNPIFAGNYTIEVTGIEEPMSAAITITAPAAASIEIVTDKLYNGSDTIAFVVKNQFGEAMSVPGTNVFATAYKTSAGTGGSIGAVALTGQSTSTFTYNPANTVVGDVMQVTLIYGTLSPATKSFQIQADPAATSILFGNISPLPGKSYIFINDAGLEIPYVLYDQYGIATKLPAHAANQDLVPDQESIGAITFITSNPNIVDPDTFVVDAAGKLTFTAGTSSGTAIITAVWNANVVGQLSITVTGTPTASAATISDPPILIAGGDPALNLSMTIIDQFGSPVTAITGPTGTITASATSGTVAVTSATTLRYTPPSSVMSSTLVTIDVYNGLTKIGTKTFYVQPDAMAAAITGISFPTLFQAGASLTIDRAWINVLDQYGRTYTGGSVTVTDGASTSFTVSAPATVNAVSIGTDVIKVKVGGTSNEYSVTVSCIADAEVVTYTLTPSRTLIYASVNPLYHATVTLTGKTAAGFSVVLNPALPTSITSNNTSIARITAGKVEGVAAGTAIIRAWNGAENLAQTSITVSTAAPTAQWIAFSSTTIAHGQDLSTILVISDQYGVNIAAPGNYAVASSNTAIISSSGIVTNTTGQNQVVRVTVVKDSVISAATDITVTP